MPGPAEELGLPAGIPVAAGGGDAAAGAVGIGAVSDGDGFISLGTSGQLFVTTSDYRPNPASRIHAYAHTVPDHWFQMAAMLNGARPPCMARRPPATAHRGAVVRRRRRRRRRRRPARSSCRISPANGRPMAIRISAPGSRGWARPRHRAVSCAEWWRQSRSPSPTPSTRCRRLARCPGRSSPSGGGTRSDFLMQTIADATSCRLGRSDGADVGPALGAARLACVASGGGSAAEVMRKPAVRQWFGAAGGRNGPAAIPARGVSGTLSGVEIRPDRDEVRTGSEQAERAAWHPSSFAIYDHPIVPIM